MWPSCKRKNAGMQADGSGGPNKADGGTQRRPQHTRSLIHSRSDRLRLLCYKPPQCSIAQRAAHGVRHEQLLQQRRRRRAARCGCSGAAQRQRAVDVAQQQWRLGVGGAGGERGCCLGDKSPDHLTCDGHTPCGSAKTPNAQAMQQTMAFKTLASTLFALDCLIKRRQRSADVLPWGHSSPSQARQAAARRRTLRARRR
jgi:hypothetical protein